MSPHAARCAGRMRRETKSGKGELPGVRGQHGRPYAELFAVGVHRREVDVEQRGVAHDLTDSLRMPDDIGSATDGPQDTQNARVEHGHDLSQSGEQANLANSQDEFAEDIVYAASRSLRLTLRVDRANARAFPYRGAFDVPPFVEELRKDVAQHVRAGRGEEPQRPP